MGKRIIKDEQFFHGFPGMFDVSAYENCSFNGVYFAFANDYTNLVFKNCNFNACSYFNFVCFGGRVRFENCRFRGTIKFGGAVSKGGNIKFTECAGLTDKLFGDFKNCNQTLSEMGLYQTFKNCILSSRKEETVYKKIGIFRKYWDGYWNCCGYAIATLTIPKGTVRYGNREGKCRCKKAIVIDIKAFNFSNGLSELLIEHPESFKYGSIRDGGDTVYEVGKEVEPNYFDYIPSRCSNGIHYFYDRRLAEAYDFS